MAEKEDLTAFDELADDLAGKLADEVRLFVLSKHQSQKAWVARLESVLEENLVDWLVGPYSDELRSRGIEPLGKESAKVIVKKNLRNTDDLRRRLLEAPDPDGITAAFSLGALMKKVHQLSIVSGLIRKIQDLFELGSVQRSRNWTGRKRWRVFNPADSRHSHLDFEVRDEFGTFMIRAGVFWPEPRWDLTDPSNSSNCLCRLEYEFIDADGVRRWR